MGVVSLLSSFAFIWVICFISEVLIKIRIMEDALIFITVTVVATAIMFFLLEKKEKKEYGL